MDTITYTLEQYTQDSWIVVVTADDYSELFSWYKAVERAQPYEEYRIRKHIASTVVDTNLSTR